MPPFLGRSGPRSPGRLRGRRPRGTAEGGRVRLAQARAQRCVVHKLRNLEGKAPKHARAELHRGAVAIWVLKGDFRTYPRNLAAWRREISLDVARVSHIGPPR